LCVAGLDPAIGLLHADADRRPSLDLMEEFCPQVVDQVVLAAVNHRHIRLRRRHPAHPLFGSRGNTGRRKLEAVGE
jgi:CRISPR-associated protein Cas1